VARGGVARIAPWISPLVPARTDFWRRTACYYAPSSTRRIDGAAAASRTLWLTLYLLPTSTPTVPHLLPPCRLSRNATPNTTATPYWRSTGRRRIFDRIDGGGARKEQAGGREVALCLQTATCSGQTGFANNADNSGSPAPSPPRLTTCRPPSPHTPYPYRLATFLPCPIMTIAILVRLLLRSLLPGGSIPLAPSVPTAMPLSEQKASRTQYITTALLSHRRLAGEPPLLLLCSQGRTFPHSVMGGRNALGRLHMVGNASDYAMAC